MLILEELEQREVMQQTVEEAPYITFGQFRQVANQRRWTFGWLLEQVKDEIEKPTDTVRRILHGALVNGKHDMVADVVIPYPCLIELYQQATQSKPAVAGENACACGCGAKVTGKRKWATPGCRKRVQRRSVIAQKMAL